MLSRKTCYINELIKLFCDDLANELLSEYTLLEEREWVLSMREPPLSYYEERKRNALVRSSCLTSGIRSVQDIIQKIDQLEHMKVWKERSSFNPIEKEFVSEEAVCSHLVECYVLIERERSCIVESRYKFENEISNEMIRDVKKHISLILNRWNIKNYVVDEIMDHADEKVRILNL